MLRILQRPDTTPQLLPTAICLSGRTSSHTCQSIRRHATLCCVVCFTENEEGGVLTGNSILRRGQTDGLCMGYLQPGGDRGNLAAVAEVRSRGSRAKAPQTVIKINCNQRLREGVCADAHRKAVIFTPCHSVTHAIHSLYRLIVEEKEAGPARLTQPKAQKLTFPLLFP